MKQGFNATQGDPCKSDKRGIWRRERDSNSRYDCSHNGFRDRPIQPLWHPSAGLRLFRLERAAEHTHKAPREQGVVMP